MLICKNNTQGVIKIAITRTQSIELSEGQFIDLLKDFSYTQLAAADELAEAILKKKVIINSGSTDLKELDAIELIRGFAEDLPKDEDGNIVIREKPFKDDDGFRKRIKGFAGKFNKQGISSETFVMQEERWMDGIELIVKGHKTGDKVQFITLDTTGVYEGVLYPPGTPLPIALDQFGEDYYLAEDVQKQGQIKSSFLARLLPGIAIQVVYEGTADQQEEDGIELYFNLFTYIKTQLPSS
jgi:hypothetical protein